MMLGIPGFGAGQSTFAEKVVRGAVGDVFLAVGFADLKVFIDNLDRKSHN